MARLVDEQKIEKNIMAVLLAGIVAIVWWQILARYILTGGRLVALGEEGGRLLVVFFTFLGAAYVHRIGGHIRLGLVVDNVGGTGRLILGVLRNIIEITFIVILLGASLAYAIRAMPLHTQNMGWPQIIFVIPLVIACVGILANSIVTAVKRKWRVD